MKKNIIDTAFKIERGIIYILLVLMAIVMVMATVELAHFLVKTILDDNGFFFNLSSLLDLFGVFLLVLIGIELLDTIKVYLKEKVVHVEVVVLVGIIALARKVVVMKVEDLTGEQLIGIAALILGLGLTYYLIKRAGLMVCDLSDPEKLKDETAKTLQQDINLLISEERAEESTQSVKEKASDKTAEAACKQSPGKA